MKNFKPIILLLCGIVFGLTAFPVFAQKAKEEVKDVSVNKRPLQDFANHFKAKFEKGEIDLDKSFKVVVEGILTKEGKFDLSLDKKTGKPKTQFTLTEGDAQMVEVAKAAIESVGDSGFFGYLRNLGAEKIKLTVAQDGETFSASIESEQKDENKAKTMASGLNSVFEVVKLAYKQDKRRFSEDEITIINGFQTPTADGTNFILNFALPKKTFHEIILHELNKSNNNKMTSE